MLPAAPGRSAVATFRTGALLWTIAAAAAQLALFPDDRSQCDSSDTACTVGTFVMAAQFPTRINEPALLELSLLYRGILNPLINAEYAPTDLDIDFTGGLTLPPAEYVTPESYVDSAGLVAFPRSNMTIHVNDTHFLPSHVSIMPNTTVTWKINTFETVGIRSENDDGAAFNSGAINRNWAPTFSVTFVEEGVHFYRNPEVGAWQKTFNGTIVVQAYNCSTYSTCATCLLYTQCIWCPGNGTCIERDPDTNVPLDTGVVAKIPHVEGREYQSIRYMEGYNVKQARMETAWFPWPPFRRNPRKVPDAEVPSYFDVTSSDQCYAYMRTRDASQCEDYVPSGLKNRVHGNEQPGRPTLTDFFACYDHLMTSWTKPDLEPPKAWEAWPSRALGPAAPLSTWETLCCDVCASCTDSILNACNMTICDGENPSPTTSSDDTTCPITSEAAHALQHGCAQYRSNSSACPSATGATVSSISSCHSVLRNATQMHNLSLVTGPRGLADGSSASRRRLERLADMAGSDQTELLLETDFKPLSGAHPLASRLSDANIASVLQEHPGAVRRRAQSADDGLQLSEWQQIPLKQRQFMPPITPDMDIWARLNHELTERFGPRCNATMGCDLTKGTCLNISGLPIMGYDQNGTCTCHAWYQGGDCSELIISEATCAGMADVEQCARIRTQLYYCGPVGVQDALPPVCLERNLTVVQCGEAGYMKGRRNSTGVPNLTGQPENGYASLTCSKCMARGEVRSETFGKTCDPAVVLAACQRFEDAFAQRLCNYCSPDTQGSVLPQRGMDRSCSYYRGTCIGSVEKRIRGIVPPNLDIVGETGYGGLRYCRRPTTFTSSRHYFVDQDIMQVGQTCLEGETPMYEGWDYSRQHDNPNTVRDKYGMACENPDDEVTCAKARFCIDADLCFTDTPDWFNMDELVRHWGLDRLRQFADQRTCNQYTVGATEGVETINEESLTTYYTADATEDGAVPLECTFTEHSLVFDPQTAYQNAKWPFISADYIDTYVKVDWSLQRQDADTVNLGGGQQQAGSS